MTPLSPVQQKFILHWGEMGTRWGINRTVAQIHALLYLSPKPLTAEDLKVAATNGHRLALVSFPHANGQQSVNVIVPPSPSAWRPDSASN